MPANIMSKLAASARNPTLKLPQQTFGLGTARADSLDLVMLARRVLFGGIAHLDAVAPLSKITGSRSVKTL
jgi:hypothetical protein